MKEKNLIIGKNGLVLPLLKKPGLDPIFKNFRPVSNLQFVVKLAEKVVISQLYLGIVQKQ